MFLPLSDDNPRLVVRAPYVTWTLIALNVAIYAVFQSGLVLDTNMEAMLGYGMIPSVVFGTATLPPGMVGAPGVSTYLTSLFLHGDPIHLIGNLLFLLVFADNIEDSMGHLRFIAFYLLCGAAGAATHAHAMPQSEAPLIGASAAISGVVAAYLMLHPRVKMWILLFARVPVKVTAFWIILAWGAVQIGAAVLGGDENVGWWAHLGGFLAGAILIPLFKRREVPWFGRAPKTITPTNPSPR